MKIQDIVEIALEQDRQFLGLIQKACDEPGVTLIVFAENHYHSLGVKMALQRCVDRWVRPKACHIGIGTRFEFPLQGVSEILIREADFGTYQREKDAILYDASWSVVDAPHAPQEFFYRLVERENEPT